MSNGAVSAGRGLRWWVAVVAGSLLLLIVLAWNVSVTARCNLIEVRQSVADAWPFSVEDLDTPGLEGVTLEEVSAIARVQSSGSEWIQPPGWDACLRIMSFEVLENLGHPDELHELPTSGTATLPGDTKTGAGELFVFLTHVPGEASDMPTNWQATLVLSEDHMPLAGFDEAAQGELRWILDEGPEPGIDAVQALVDLRLDVLAVERAWSSGDPYWRVGPWLSALLRFKNQTVRDHLGAPELDVWLEWDPVDRHLGWSRNHLPDGAAAALEIEWGNGEVVVIHHTLTTDSVSHVGLLSEVGLTGPEALVPGGGEVSVRGQFARATPLTLVLFDPDGDIAITHPVPEAMLRALDDRIAVAVDLDLRGAFNWRALDRPPS